ncbi:MAG: hypothetical protein WCH34_11375 [Bacteroidota bacterium]
MDKEIEAKLNATNVVNSYIDEDEHAALIETDDAMKEDVLHYKGNIADLGVQVEIAQFNYKGITANQTTAIVNLAEYLNQHICAPSRRYARKIKDNNLLSIFKPTDSTIKGVALSEVISVAKSVIDKAETLIATVPAYATSTKITTLVITEANSLKTNVSGLLGQAKSKRAEVGVALGKISDIIKDIWEYDFPNMLDSAQHFNTDHPEFSKGLARVMKINSLPIEHTGIHGYMKDADGNAIIGGTVKNLDNPKREAVTTNNLGYYEDIQFKWGVIRFQFLHPDFKTQIATLEILRGRKLEYNVVMVKK